MNYTTFSIINEGFCTDFVTGPFAKGKTLHSKLNVNSFDKKFIKRTRTKRIREKTGERTANLVLEINGNTKPCRGNKMNSYISVKLSTGQGRLKFKDLFDMIGAPSWIRGVIHNRLSTAHEISCAFFTPHSEFSRQEERQWILNHSGNPPAR